MTPKRIAWGSSLGIVGAIATFAGMWLTNGVPSIGEFAGLLVVLAPLGRTLVIAVTARRRRR